MEMFGPVRSVRKNGGLRSAFGANGIPARPAAKVGRKPERPWERRANTPCGEKGPVRTTGSNVLEKDGFAAGGFASHAAEFSPGGRAEEIYPPALLRRFDFQSRGEASTRENRTSLLSDRRQSGLKRATCHQCGQLRDKSRESDVFSIFRWLA